MNPNLAIGLSRNYSDLLRKSEEDRAFLLAHKETLPVEKFDALLENTNRDINYARSRLQHVSTGIQAPRIPSLPPEIIDPGEVIVMPERKAVMETPVSGSAPSSSPDNLWLLGSVVAGLVAAPFIASWVSKDPEKNLATVQDVLKIVKMTSGYGRS